MVALTALTTALDRRVRRPQLPVLAEALAGALAPTLPPGDRLTAPAGTRVLRWSRSTSTGGVLVPVRLEDPRRWSRAAVVAVSERAVDELRRRLAQHGTAWPGGAQDEPTRVVLSDTPGGTWVTITVGGLPVASFALPAGAAQGLS